MALTKTICKKVRYVCKPDDCKANNVQYAILNILQKCIHQTHHS
jgi:hypothetical protein